MYIKQLRMNCFEGLKSLGCKRFFQIAKLIKLFKISHNLMAKWCSGDSQGGYS